MSILKRLRANGGDLIRHGYSFRLHPGRLAPEQIDWLKRNIEALKSEAWPAYDDWQERAAIMEYDGGMTREDAEAAAYQCVEGGRAQAA